MSDFRGEFEWIKNIVEGDGSPFKGKIGYEENSGKDITILDVLSVITLFHPEFDQKEDGQERAPVIAYANKGRMDARLADEKLRDGYKELAPLVVDILNLHDYVYANFEGAYNAVFGDRAKLGRREGVESRLMGEPHELPLTGTKSNYVLPAGFIFPVLASLRSLVYRRGGKIGWRREPFKFFDKYGKKLVGELMEQVDAAGGNPNKVGKQKLAYTAIHSQAQICLYKEIEEGSNNK